MLPRRKLSRTARAAIRVVDCQWPSTVRSSEEQLHQQKLAELCLAVRTAIHSQRQLHLLTLNGEGLVAARLLVDDAEASPGEAGVLLRKIIIDLLAARS